MQNPSKRGWDEADVSADNVPAKRLLAEDNGSYWNRGLSQRANIRSGSDVEIAAENVDVPMTDAMAPLQHAESICYGAVGLVPT